jgi:two-component system NtrC family response regulator
LTEGRSEQQPTQLLVVEDDEGLLRQLKWAFEGFEILTASDRIEALAIVRRCAPTVVTLDLGLPPDPGGISEGFQALTEIISLAPETKVIVVTGHDDRDNAIRAIGLGAYDFYEKPIDPDTLRLAVERAARLAQLEDENRKLSAQRDGSPFDALIAVSPEMAKVCRTLEKLAPTDVTTLILGESGTGKEVLLRVLHAISNRAGKPLVAINCAAIPETLLESELFGYERGAFTGATRTTRGKFEVANGGILFLDEIGDLPFALQAKLLRFLQERIVDRIGSRRGIPVDVRVVCATHQDLEGLIEKGSFREDLYYRINEATIMVPPLREREGDAVVLARAFLNRFAHQHRRPVRDFTDHALAVIESYSWPGNVRELENRVKRAVIMSEGPTITAQDLELADATVKTEPFELREIRERAERRAILRAFHFSGNNVSRTAELLGITRPTLYNLLKKYDIDNH